MPERLAPAAQALTHATHLLARAPKLAEQQAAAILEALPGHPEARLIQGIARRLQGDAPGARDILGELSRTQPRSARTYYELAMTLASLGDDAEAVSTLRRAVALAPAMTEAWRTLGDLLTVAGDTAGADAAYARHIRTAVNDPDLMRAGDALCEGRLDIAERMLKERLKGSPTDVAAIRMLAETATRLGRNEDAERLLDRCLELAPSFRQARHNYAIVLFRQNKAHQAIPHIDKLLADNPGDPSYRSLLAACLALAGEFGRAINIYGSVLEQFPQQPKIWMSYGHALRTAGRREESVAAYHRSIELAPALGEAYWSLANLKTEAFSAAEIEAMRAQLSRDALTAEDRVHFHFALGRALEQACDYADSFQHYADGARVWREMIEYDADTTRKHVERAREVFGGSLFARNEGAGDADPAPIFVVGLPRSGSTLIEQILSSHSEVEGTMELADLAVLTREAGTIHNQNGTIRYPEFLTDLPAAAFAELGAKYIERTRLYRKTTKPFFIDKMPNNWIHIGLIQLILPNAKIIDARRHPVATCFSAFKQHFARGQHFSYDLHELGRYYCDYVRMMEHFDTVLPGRVHRVSYEAMVGDIEAETRRLLDYCGLAFEPACLRFWETGRAVRTASSEQVRRPIYREGLDHWAHYRPWLGPLLDALSR